jgi:hypothetical protein
VNVTVKVEMESAVRELRGIRDEKLPLAIAKSLTWTAGDAQRKVQQALPLRFTIRRLGWAKKGVRTIWATPQNLQAVVQDIHEYMGLQEEGGTKTRGGRVFTWENYICVPIVGGARRKPGSIVRKDDYPDNLMKSGGGGFVHGRVMYKRLAKARRYTVVRGPGAVLAKKESSHLLPMYVLVPSAHVGKRYGFEQIVREAVDQLWRGRFDEAWAKTVGK